MDYEKVCDILLCPICTEIALPPIFQCPKGHILCHDCIPKLGDGLCPTCRCDMPPQQIRALALEQLADSLELKCKHWSKGCVTTHSLQNIDVHLSNCIYEADNLCQLFGSESCKAVSSLPDFAEHCQTRHSESTRILNNGNGAHCIITASVLLGDLYNNVDLVWEPSFIVFGKEVSVILPKYLGSSKQFQWSLVNLRVSDNVTKNLPTSSHGLEIVRKLDSDSDSKITWIGKCQEFTKFKQNSLQKDAWDPKVTCSFPLECFVDGSKSQTAVDRANLCIFEVSLIISRKQDPEPIQIFSRMSFGTVNSPFNPLPAETPSQIFGLQTIPLEMHSYHKSSQRVKEPTSATVFELECNRCDNTIVGVAYTCTSCPDYDLCGPCTQTGTHSEHILIRKLFPEIQITPQNEVLVGQGVNHGHAHCDACGIQIRGVRFKCCLCLDLDICETCEGKGFHNFHWCLRTTHFDEEVLSTAIYSVRRDNGM